MQFILIEELISFHLRGQPTSHEKNSGSYTDFPVNLSISLILMTSSLKFDDVITKTKNLYISFCSLSDLLLKIAKFGDV